MAEKNFKVFLDLFKPTFIKTIVGASGFDNSSGVLTWTDDIANCADNTTTTSGVYVSYNSAVMNYFPYNAITEYTDDSGNVFMRFPKLYMAWTTNSSGVITGVRFANYLVDSSFFIPDCFLDPTDTTGSTYLDYVDIGKYEGSGSSSKVYSTSGATCLANITRADFRTGCRSYGTSSNAYNGYQQLDFSMLTMYNYLVCVLTKTANIQTVYGGRTGSGGHTWSAASETGTLDSLTGLNGWNTTTDCVKFLGVENPYGNIQKWVDGVYFSGSTIYAHRLPTNFADSTTNALNIGFTRPTSSNYISAMSCGTSTSSQSYAYCSAAAGSSSTYYGDYCYYISSGVVLDVGGSWSKTTNAGLFCLYGDLASVAYSDAGGRLCHRPI